MSVSNEESWSQSKVLPINISRGARLNSVSHACFSQYTVAHCRPIASGTVTHVLLAMSRVVYHPTPAVKFTSNVSYTFI